jgi:hypothetical protein
MKKVLVAVLLLACLSAAPLFAADSKFPSSIAPGSIIADLGMGFLGSMVLNERGTLFVPPLCLSVEYALPISIPLSVGAVIGYTSNRQTGGSGDAKYTYTWPVFSIGAKVAYHFGWQIRGLDTYAAMTIGANIMSAKTDFDEGYYSTYAIKPSAGDKATLFLFGLEIGARFFFNDHFGAFIEEGFNTFTFFRSGLVFKF